MEKVNWAKQACFALLLCAATAIALRAQTLTTVDIFNSVDGAKPLAALVHGTDGNLYGTTGAGGANGHGTVFKITPSGTLTTLYSFCPQGYPCTDGFNPIAALVQGTDGNFYGTNTGGGAYPDACVGSGCGTVFKITRSGTLTTLHSFAGYPTDGGAPTAALVQDGDANFYGTTTAGGANGVGTVFKITRWGTLTTLYSFCSESHCTDGEDPMGALVQDRDGNFYGTTAFGGAHGDGTVFKITRSGELTTLYSFCSQSDCADGELPYAALVQDRDGNFYGTTYRGGTYNKGTVFKITPWGALTTLHSFEGTDGASPYYAALVQDSDGDFYGTTQLGGTYNKGTVFKITPWDTLTTLLSFQCTATEGCEPDAGLVQGSHGKFYGTTYYGGPTSGPCSPHGCGTVFSLSGIPR